MYYRQKLENLTPKLHQNHTVFIIYIYSYRIIFDERPPHSSFYSRKKERKKQEHTQHNVGFEKKQKRMNLAPRNFSQGIFV